MIIQAYTYCSQDWFLLCSSISVVPQIITNVCSIIIHANIRFYRTNQDTPAGSAARRPLLDSRHRLLCRLLIFWRPSAPPPRAVLAAPVPPFRFGTYNPPMCHHPRYPTFLFVSRLPDHTHFTHTAHTPLRTLHVHLPLHTFSQSLVHCCNYTMPSLLLGRPQWCVVRAGVVLM